MRVAFLSVNKRGAFKMRGSDISRHSSLFEASTFLFRNIRVFHKFIVPNYDFFVFVKNFDEDLARLIKSYGKAVIFDPIDNFFWGSPSADFNSSFIDAIIASNDVHKRFLRKSGKPVFVIQHHHTNFNNVVKKFSQVKRLGYIGLPFQLESRDKILSYCAANDLEWYESSPRRAFIKEALKIDVGVVFLDMNKKRKPKMTIPYNYENYVERYFNEIISFKPATKFLLFASLGIPCVAVPYESYKEVVRKSGVKIPFVNDIYELFSVIDRLRSDKVFFNKFRVDMLRVANNYNISRIVLDYYELFLSMNKKLSK